LEVAFSAWQREVAEALGRQVFPLLLYKHGLREAIMESKAFTLKVQQA
jgi:hypothetical protein